MSLNYVTRLALRRTGICEDLLRFAGATSKPRPVQLEKLPAHQPTEEDWAVLYIRGQHNASAEVQPIEQKAAPAAFNWTLRKDSAHKCADWDPSDLDQLDNPPSLWCPACRYVEEMAHQERSRKAAAQPRAMTGVQAAVMCPTKPCKPIVLEVNDFQKTMIDAGGAAGKMLRDSLISKDHMLAWADYCELEDPRFFDVKPITEEERARIEASRIKQTATIPIRSVRIRGGGRADDREAETRAWLATPRNKRFAFYKGKQTTDLCTPKDNSIIVAGILNDAQTAYGDLRQLLGDIAPVVDLYRPNKPGAPMFVGFLTEADVAKVIAAFPAGIRYNGRLLPVERAIARSKTTKEMSRIARASASS